MAGAEYAFRGWLSRQLVADVLHKRVQSLAYTNFKDSIEDIAYHDAALAALKAMYRYQYQQSERTA